MATRNLRWVDFPLTLGLTSNYADRTNQGLTEAVNVDGFDQFRSIGEIPGSSVQSNDHGGPVTSIHDFQFFDLTGTLRRQQLSVADGKLHRIEADKTLTVLKDSGLPSDRMVDAQSLDRIHITSEKFVGETGGLKFDGTNVRNWGVQAPGGFEITKLPLNDSGLWTSTPDVQLSNSGVSRDGEGSIQLDKTGTTSIVASMTRSGISVNLSDAGNDEVFFWVFIPAGALQKLLTMTFSVDDGNDSSLAAFDKGSLVPGWNLMAVNLNDIDPGVDLSLITSISFGLFFTSASATQSGFLFDRLFVTTDGTPSAAVGGAGSLNGTFRYRYTFLTETGVESNAGPPSPAVTATDEQITVSNLLLSPDPQVIARRVYRDLNGDGLFRFVGQINTDSTSFTDDVGVPGTINPPLAGDDLIDASPPRPMKDVARHGPRLVGIDAENPFILLLSDVNRPEEFRIVDEIQIEQSAVRLESFPQGTLVFTTDETLVLTGDGVNSPFRVDLLNPQLGANGLKAGVKLKGGATITLREDEVFLVDVRDVADPWFVGGAILDRFRALTALDDVHVVHDRDRFRAVFFFPTDLKAFVYQYGAAGFQQITGEGAGTDPLDLRTGVWWEMNVPQAVFPIASQVIEREPDVPELWVGAPDGFVYRFQDRASNVWADGASGSIGKGSIFTTTSLPIGVDAQSRAEPRYLAIEAEAETALSRTVFIGLLSDADGAVLAIEEFQVDFPAGPSSQIIPIPAMGVRGEWATVGVLNFGVSVGDFRISSIRLGSIPRTGFRGPRSK